jgi:hypothetical protein
MLPLNQLAGSCPKCDEVVKVEEKTPVLDKIWGEHVDIDKKCLACGFEWTDHFAFTCWEEKR